MRWLHSVHVSGAMVLGSLTWVRRFVFRWAPWHGIHWRPAGGKPVQKSNASTFLMGCARAWEVGSMLGREDVLALCRQALAGQLCCASALGERAWPKSVQNSNGDRFLKVYTIALAPEGGTQRSDNLILRPRLEAPSWCRRSTKASRIQILARFCAIHP